MNKLVQLVAITACCFLLMGCPYETEVPISDPSVKFPAELLGKWAPQSSSDEIITIKKKTDYIVSISKTKKEPKADDKPEEYEAYLSEVDAVKFLNISELSEQGSGANFYLYKMEVAANGSRITLNAVTENIDEQFSNSAELKSFIQRNMHLSFFYEKEEEIYQRIK
ncbi:hypothetical protein [Lacibacter sp.]|uniref:hypothetical protein n=1 Tax=Lacibacter sp. TaxID=1915409 RepID=UPI002B4AE344|nr:hypothetical protein [Lacibacter sp.]HLP38481.1 hypothetical protein [Lacibacter sp.]